MELGCISLFCIAPTDQAIPDDITIEVSCLPPGISAGDLEIYFEGQGGNVEVLSAMNLGSGNARVQLTGLTVEGTLALWFSSWNITTNLQYHHMIYHAIGESSGYNQRRVLIGLL